MWKGRWESVSPSLFLDNVLIVLPSCLASFSFYFSAGSDPMRDKDLEFRLNRYRKYADFFDDGDGDWLWQDINIGKRV